MNKHEQDLYNQALRDSEKYYNALLYIKEILKTKCFEHLDGATSSDCEECFIDIIQDKISEVTNG